MLRRKITALITAAVMLFCGGIPQQTVSAELDKTVFLTVGSGTGTAGSSVPVSVDIRTEYKVWMLGLTLQYDSSLTPTAADPDRPDSVRSEADLRKVPHAKPDRTLHDIFYNAERHEIYPSYTKEFQQGTITVWFDIPADAAVGTEYALNLKADVLLANLTERLPASVTNGKITVSAQPPETVPPAKGEAAFDITADSLDLTKNGDSTLWAYDPLWGGIKHTIAYTASENLDYIEWSADNEKIYVNEKGQISEFRFKESFEQVRGTVTATAYFLDGTVLTDTVSVLAKNRSIIITDPVIGTPEVVDFVTMPSAEATTAKTTAATAKETAAATKATTAATKATAATTKTTTAATKTTTAATKATTATTKATATTAKATTATTKATTAATKTTTAATKTTTAATKATAATTKATAATTKTTTAATKATTTITTAVQTTPAAPPEPEILIGDVDDDGTVSAEDVQLALKAYTKRISGKDTELTARQNQAADVNGDAELSVDDVQNILIYYVNNTVAGKHLTWEVLLGKQPLPYLRTEAPKKRADSSKKETA